MGIGVGMWLLLLAVSGLLCLQQEAMGAVYQMRWTNYDLTTHQAPNYDLWASSQLFYPADQFVFQYTANFHTIHQFVNRSCYESCDFKCANQLDAGESGTFMWEAVDAGTFYFGCKTPVEGFGYHCTGGQKVAIKILQNLAFPPPPS